MPAVLAVPALAAVFLVLNLTSLLFAYGPGSIALFWPGNGFLLAMLLTIRKERRIPLLSLAALALIAVNLAQGKPMVPSLGFSLVNILEFMLVLRLLRGIPPGEARFLGDERGVLRFFLPITLTSAAGAVAGGFMASVCFGGSFLWHAATWFVVDAASLAAVTPAFLAWMHRDFAWPAGWRRDAEFAACLGLSILIAFAVFARPEALWRALGHPMTYLAFPPLVWAAIRFGARGASTVVLAIYVISAWYTSRGFGPYAAAEGAHGALFLPMQFFPYAGAFCSLLPAVLFHAHKRAERELRFRESRFGDLWSSRLIGIFVSDFTGKITEANDTFLGMIGRPRADLEAGRISSADMVTPEYVAGSEERRRVFRTEGRMGPYDREWLLQDGSRLSTLFFATRMEETSSALCMVLDITVLKRTQAELERAMTSARTANLAKSDFLAHMSHEIRTPMNGVLGTLALLQGTRLDAEQRSYARTCRESGEHLLALINQVLDFSRIENGALELDLSEFPLGAVVEGALAPLQEAAQKKGLELVKRMQPGLPAYFRGDPMRLQQILLNLIGNAVKFSDHGEVSVSVRLRQRMGDRCRLDFEIADRGPGISPESLATLFQPFRQGDQSLSRKAGGTGLGLAISKELAGRMGGSIEVDSRPGEGSRFRFDVLLEAAAAPAGDPPRPGDRADGRTALVLEPHPDHLDHLSDLLSASGYRVLPAASPGDFLRAVSGDGGARPDIAVLSVSMQDGTAAWEEEAVAACRNSGIPVLCTLPFITQSRGPGILEAGAAGILAKPFRSADVRDALRSLQPMRPEPDGTADREPPADGGAGAQGGETRPAWAAREEPPRILVVDDHPVNLTVASSMLAKLGCRVETAPDGPSALEAFARLDFDLVFMDCQMPVMDGFEATRRLRALETSGSRVPVIALTAHAVNGFRERCLSQGLDDYLSKPFSPGNLAAALRTWIPEGRRGDAGPEAGGRDATERVDWDHLAAFDDGTPEGRDDMQNLIGLFLDSSREGLEEMRGAHSQGRRDELARLLHRFKGSCATLGAVALFRLAADLESEIDRLPADEVAERLDGLEQEFSGTAVALRKPQADLKP